MEIVTHFGSIFMDCLCDGMYMLRNIQYEYNNVPLSVKHPYQFYSMLRMCNTFNFEYEVCSTCLGYGIQYEVRMIESLQYDYLLLILKGLACV